jgi:hypothetical protein
MEATGALPTEKRVREMNNYQWLWYYMNIIESKKRRNEERDNIIQYMSYFWNYDMAKSVAEQKEAEKRKKEREEAKKNNTEVQYNPYEERNVLAEGEVYNDTFDDEIESILANERQIELPGSGNKVSSESKEEFMERAFNIEKLLQESPNIKELQYIEPEVKKIKRQQREEMMRTENTVVRNRGERPLLVNPKKAKKPSTHPTTLDSGNRKNTSNEHTIENERTNIVRNNVVRNNKNHKSSKKPVLKNNNEIVGFKKSNEVEDLLSFDKFKSSANNDDLDIITSPTNEK